MLESILPILSSFFRMLDFTTEILSTETGNGRNKESKTMKTQSRFLHSN